MKRREFLRQAVATPLALGASPLTSFAAKRGYLTLGLSKIVVPKGALIGTQIDRVFRDIAWKDSAFDKNAKLGWIANAKSPLVPYMEGRLTMDIASFADAKVIGLTPTRARRYVDEYLAADGEGRYRFEIDPSKVEYSTAMFDSTKKHAYLPDSHGFNMIAGEAVQIHQVGNLNLAIACMDLPSKAQAALYMADKGINCFGPCDRFGHELIGYKTKNKSAATIIGSAPVRRKRSTAVIGDQPIDIRITERIIVQNTERGYPDQYCDTPGRYFQALEKLLDRPMNLCIIEANVGETNLIIKEAKRQKASVIGVRVHNDADAAPVRKWLAGNSNRRAVLFHSAPYESGYSLFFEFPEQTSFGDLDPKLGS